MMGGAVSPLCNPSQIGNHLTLVYNKSLVDKSVLAAPEIRANPALQASMKQIEHGRPIPIVPQMRQIWEGMRGPYQLVMSGAITAKEAARRMQREAEKISPIAICDDYLVVARTRLSSRAAETAEGLLKCNPWQR
ncbi:MAG: hypothetical protein ABIR38_02940 [Chthoniobacterales bacterium]